MNAIARQLESEIRANIKISTNENVKQINQLRPPAGHDHTPVHLNQGEITLAGLEAVSNSFKRQRENALSNAALQAAAGMVATTEEAPTEKEIARKKLLDNMLKNGNPERLYQQLCAGVATRNKATGQPFLRASTARWLAQEITNQVTRLAGNAIIERRRESGITVGVDFTQDDAGMFVGTVSTNTDDLDLVRGGQQTTDNLFLQHCDDADTVEATFNDWYESIEIPLSALAGAVMMADDSIMLYGHFCRWEEGAKGLTQVIDTLDDFIHRELMRRNDRDAGRTTTTAVDELSKLFG
jgi:hypothetical protein